MKMSKSVVVILFSVTLASYNFAFPLEIWEEDYFDIFDDDSDISETKVEAGMYSFLHSKFLRDLLSDDSYETNNIFESDESKQIGSYPHFSCNEQEMVLGILGELAREYEEEAQGNTGLDDMWTDLKKYIPRSESRQTKNFVNKNKKFPPDDVEVFLLDTRK